MFEMSRKNTTVENSSSQPINPQFANTQPPPLGGTNFSFAGKDTTNKNTGASPGQNQNKPQQSSGFMAPKQGLSGNAPQQSQPNKNPRKIVDMTSGYTILKKIKQEKDKGLVKEELDLIKINFNLFFRKEQSNQQEKGNNFQETMELFTHDKIPNVVEIHLKLWFEVAKRLDTQLNYCSFKAICSLIRSHILINQEIYLDNQNKFSQKIINDYPSIFQQSSFPNQSFTLNTNCPLFYKIVGQIKEQIVTECQYLKCIFKIMAHKPEKLYQVFTKEKISEKIVSNMIESLETILTISEKPVIDFKKTRDLIQEQVLQAIIDSLIAIHDNQYEYLQRLKFKQDKISWHMITENNAQQLFRVIDDKIGNCQQFIRKKLICLCVQVVFRGPFQVDDWSKQSQKDQWAKSIQISRSFFLEPFHWVLECSSSVQYIKFHYIQGREWLRLCNCLISLSFQKEKLKKNVQFQNMLFYLICSIISESPMDFWRKNQDYEMIYLYISYLGEIIEGLWLSQSSQIQYEDQQTQEVIGMMIRLMICTYPSEESNDQQQISVHQIFNTFNNVMFQGDAQVSNTVLFGKFILPYVLSFEKSQQNITPVNQIELKFNYQLPLVAYEAIAKLVSLSPQLMIRFTSFYNKTAATNDRFQTLGKIDTQLMIYETFSSYLQVIFQQNRESQKSQNTFETFLSTKDHSLPILFAYLNSLLKSNHQQIKNQTLDVLEEISGKIDTQVLNMNDLRNMFKILLQSEKTIEAFTDHIVCLYEKDLFSTEWNTKLCLPLLHQLLENCQIPMFKHYAKVFSGVLTKIISPSLPLSSQSSQYNREQILEGMMRYFFRHTDYLLQFVSWALKIEQNIKKPYKFYNILFETQQFETLYYAIGLLENLMKLHQKFTNQFFIPQQIRSYFSIFIFERKNQDFSLNGPKIDRNYHYSNITLSDNKIATLPAALVNLALSQIPKNPVKEQKYALLSIKTVYNILSLLILNHVESNTPIDYKIYQSFYIDDYAREYCSAAGLLEEHLKMSLNQTTNQDCKMLHGEMIDLLLNCMKLKSKEQIRGLIEIIKPRISENLNNICMGQIQALSRVGIKLGSVLNQKSESSINNSICGEIGQCLEDILKLLSREIFDSIERIQANPKLQISPHPQFQVLVTNFFVIFRHLQISVKNRKVFSKLVKDHLQILFHPYLFAYYSHRLQVGSLTHTDTTGKFELNERSYEQYFTALQIILCCKTYLSPEEFNSLANNQGFQKMITEFVQQIAKNPKFYMLLSYGLNMISGTASKNPKIFTATKGISKMPNRSSQDNNFYETLNSSTNFTKLSIFCVMLTCEQNEINQSFIPINSNSIVTDFNPEDFREDQKRNGFNYHQQIIPESILLHVLQSNKLTIEKALDMGETSYHSLTFISVMCHLYEAIINKSINIQKYNPSKNYIVDRIIDFCESILQLDGSHFKERELIYMKAWACTLLNAILYISEIEDVHCRIIQLAINSHVLLSPLGKLLERYGRCSIKWPYNSSSEQYSNTLGLLQKQFLLSLLKLFSSIFANINPQDRQNKQRYNRLCQSFIKASRILSPKSTNTFNFSSHQLPSDTNRPRNGYETILESIRANTFIMSALYDEDHSQIHKKMTKKSSELLKKSNTNQNQNQFLKYARSLFSGVSNCLDFTHSHLDTLIIQRYLMILSACYENPKIDYFEYEDLLLMMESLLKKIVSIGGDQNNYNIITSSLNRKIWLATHMSEELYYLNHIEEQFDEQFQLLNDTFEIGITLCCKLKRIMEMHKNYGDFMGKAIKLMREVKKGQLQIDVIHQIEEAGFLERSQQGQSFMSRSFRFK